MRKLEISELHDLLFETLSFVDDICKKHNIQYYLAYGTLLGAVRGKDFIPWDPDIDLFMSRENYQKFCEIMKKEPDEKYFLDTVESNPYSTAPLEGRVCIKSTMIQAGIECKVPLCKEIRIDIAPLDYSSYDKEFVIRRNERIKIYQKMVYLKNLHIINKSKVLSYVLHAALKVIPYNLTLQKLLRIAGENRETDTSKYICLTAAYTCNKKKPFRNEYPVKWFGEPKPIMFHGREFPSPCDSHEFLKYFYGENYMTPIRREETKEYFILDKNDNE